MQNERFQAILGVGIPTPFLLFCHSGGCERTETLYHIEINLKGILPHSHIFHLCCMCLQSTLRSRMEISKFILNKFACPRGYVATFIWPELTPISHDILLRRYILLTYLRTANEPRRGGREICPRSKTSSSDWLCI